MPQKVVARRAIDFRIGMLKRLHIKKTVMRYTYNGFYNYYFKYLILMG